MEPKIRSLSNAALLVDAKNGGKDALEELLLRHEPQIYRFGLHMCSNEEDAKDVLQETLVSAFKGLSGFRGEADLSTWLYQVARSFCIKAHRKPAGAPDQTASLESRAAQEVAASEDPPDSIAYAREVGTILHTAILALPEQYREVIVLKDIEGLSAEKMAEVLQEEVAAVKSRLHRARAELRKQLASLGITSPP